METHIRTIAIRRAIDGTWVANPQPPLPAVTDHVTGGWPEIVRLRNFYEAVHRFDTSEDLKAFVAEFGEPPHEDTQVG